MEQKRAMKSKGSVVNEKEKRRNYHAHFFIIILINSFKQYKLSENTNITNSLTTLQMLLNKQNKQQKQTSAYALVCEAGKSIEKRS